MAQDSPPLKFISSSVLNRLRQDTFVPKRRSGAVGVSQDGSDRRDMVSPLSVSKRCIRYESKVFDNRRDRIIRIAEGLNRSDQKIVLVSGEQGTGKTSLCRGIIELMGGGDEQLLWFDVSIHTDFDEIISFLVQYITYICSSLNIEAPRGVVLANNTFEKLEAWLDTIQEIPLLLVIDNMEHIVNREGRIYSQPLKELLNFLLSFPNVKVMLVGERLPLADLSTNVLATIPIPLEGLDEAESIRWLHGGSGHKETPPTEEELAIYQTVVNLSGGKPWLLRLFLYLARYTEETLPGLVEEWEGFCQQGLTPTPAVALILYQRLSPEEKSLAQVMSFFRHSLDMKTLTLLSRMCHPELDSSQVASITQSLLRPITKINFPSQLMLEWVQAHGGSTAGAEPWLELYREVKNIIYDQIPPEQRRRIHRLFHDFYQEEMKKDPQQRHIKARDRALRLEAAHHGQAARQYTEAGYGDGTDYGVGASDSLEDRTYLAQTRQAPRTNRPMTIEDYRNIDIPGLEEEDDHRPAPRSTAPKPADETATDLAQWIDHLNLTPEERARLMGEDEDLQDWDDEDEMDELPGPEVENGDLEEDAQEVDDTDWDDGDAPSRVRARDRSPSSAGSSVGSSRRGGAPPSQSEVTIRVVYDGATGSAPPGEASGSNVPGQVVPIRVPAPYSVSEERATTEERSNPFVTPVSLKTSSQQSSQGVSHIPELVVVEDPKPIERQVYHPPSILVDAYGPEPLKPAETILAKEEEQRQTVQPTASKDTPSGAADYPRPQDIPWRSDDPQDQERHTRYETLWKKLNEEGGATSSVRLGRSELADVSRDWLGGALVVLEEAEDEGGEQRNALISVLEGWLHGIHHWPVLDEGAVRIELGQLLAQSYRHNDALGQFRRAVALLKHHVQELDEDRQPQAHQWMGQAYNAMGDILSFRNQFRAAKTAYQGAIQHYKQADDSSRQAESYFKLAQLCDRVGADGDAVRYYHLAFKLDKAAGNYALCAATLSNIGAIHLEHQRLGDALKALNASLRYDQYSHQPEGQLKTLELLAQLYLRRQDWAAAEEAYSRALELAEAHLPSPAAAALHTRVGDYYRRYRKSADQALAHYEKARKLAWDELSQKSQQLLSRRIEEMNRVRLSPESQSPHRGTQ